MLSFRQLSRLIFGATIAVSNAITTGNDQVEPEIVKKISSALQLVEPANTPKKPRQILLFSKTNGFRHGSIPVAVKSLTMLGEKTGAWATVHSEDDASFESDRLDKFDAVIMVNTTGEVFRSKEWPTDAMEKREAQQREAMLKKNLVDFVKSGKGLAGTHSATDTYKSWKQYNEMMGGAFVSHPWHMDVPVRLLDPGHPLLKVFGGEGFTVHDEIYQFRNDTANPANRRMLLSLDPNFDQLSKGNRKDKFYPISWISTYGQGRTFYCSLGHRDEIYYNPVVLTHYLAGFQYALGDLNVDATPIDVD